MNTSQTGQHAATELAAPTPAGFWPRLGAAVADTIILVVLAVPVAVIVPLAGWNELLLWAAYFSLLEGGSSGQTIGKRLAGIRVVDAATGGPLGIGRALLRHIVRIISGLAFFLGYLWMIWDPRKQTWHDKAVDALVVPTRARGRSTI
jgi:uncharacterized RDD family membrane protein YckC